MKFKFLDRERELKYTFKDIMFLRTKYADTAFPIEEIAALVSHGLRREDPDITPERVAEIIDMATFDELCAAVRKASGLAKPDAAVGPTTESSGAPGPSPDTTSDSPTANSGN